MRNEIVHSFPSAIRREERVAQALTKPNAIPNAIDTTQTRRVELVLCLTPFMHDLHACVLFLHFAARVSH
jgi:hypothetical protein